MRTYQHSNLQLARRGGWACAWSPSSKQFSSAPDKAEPSRRMHWSRSGKFICFAVYMGRWTFDLSIRDELFFCRQARRRTSMQAENWTAHPYSGSGLHDLPRLYAGCASVVGLGVSYRAHYCRTTASAPLQLLLFPQWSPKSLSRKDQIAAPRKRAVRRNKMCVYILHALEPIPQDRKMNPRPFCWTDRGRCSEGLANDGQYKERRIITF